MAPSRHNTGDNITFMASCTLSPLEMNLLSKERIYHTHPFRSLRSVGPNLLFLKKSCGYRLEFLEDSYFYIYSVVIFIAYLQNFSAYRLCNICSKGKLLTSVLGLYCHWLTSVRIVVQSRRYIYLVRHMLKWLSFVNEASWIEKICLQEVGSKLWHFSLKTLSLSSFL